MAKHKSYGNKPFAKFFKNKIKEPKGKDDVRGIFINGRLLLDEETKEYLLENSEMIKDVSNMFKNCSNISSITLDTLPTKYVSKSDKK